MAWFNRHPEHRLILCPDGNLFQQAIIGEHLAQAETDRLSRAVVGPRVELMASNERTALSDAQRQISTATRPSRAETHQERHDDSDNVSEEVGLVYLGSEMTVRNMVGANHPSDVGPGVNRMMAEVMPEIVMEASSNAEALTAHNGHNSELSARNSLLLTADNLRLLQASTFELEESFQDSTPSSPTETRQFWRTDVSELALEAVEEGVAHLEENLELMLNAFQAQHLERQPDHQLQDFEALWQRPNNVTVSSMSTNSEEEFNGITGTARSRHSRVYNEQCNRPFAMPQLSLSLPHGSQSRLITAALERLSDAHAQPHQGQGLDDSRGSPPLDEDLQWVKMSCVICFSQMSRIVVVPCGKYMHLLK